MLCLFLVESAAPGRSLTNAHLIICIVKWISAVLGGGGNGKEGKRRTRTWRMMTRKR